MLMYVFINEKGMLLWNKSHKLKWLKREKHVSWKFFFSILLIVMNLFDHLFMNFLKIILIWRFEFEWIFILIMILVYWNYLRSSLWIKILYLLRFILPFPKEEIYKTNHDLDNYVLKLYVNQDRSPWLLAFY